MNNPKLSLALVPTAVLARSKTQGAQREVRRRLRREAKLWRGIGGRVIDGASVPVIGIRRHRKPRRVRLGNTIGVRSRRRWRHKPDMTAKREIFVPYERRQRQ